MKDLFISMNHRVRALIRQVQLMRQPQRAEVKPSLAERLNPQSVLMSDVMIEGQLHCDENLMIDCQFKGTINAQNNTVAVGSGGRVYADITAKKVIIDGTVKGNITADDRVTLAANSRITGNIQAAVVDVENGARVKGIIEMDPQQVEVVEVQAEVRAEISSVAEPS